MLNLNLLNLLGLKKTKSFMTFSERVLAFV